MGGAGRAALATFAGPPVGSGPSEPLEEEIQRATASQDVLPPRSAGSAALPLSVALSAALSAAPRGASPVWPAAGASIDRPQLLVRGAVPLPAAGPIGAPPTGTAAITSAQVASAVSLAASFAAGLSSEASGDGTGAAAVAVLQEPEAATVVAAAVAAVVAVVVVGAAAVLWKLKKSPRRSNKLA